MNNERLAILIAVLLAILVLIGAGLSYIFIIEYYNYERHRPQITEPLIVGFKVATGTGDYKYTNIGIENDRVASFNLPTNSRLEFTYHVGCHAKDTQHNVTLYFDYVNENLSFLDTQNQSYSIPFKTEIGTMEPNAVKQYSSIMETPALSGVYQMNWHVTSNQTSYSFVIYIHVVE
jgi:hypothetical protein